MHVFRQEKVPQKEPETDGPSDPKKPKKEYSETVTVKKLCEFEELESVLATSLDTLTPRQLRRFPVDYFITRGKFIVWYIFGTVEPDLKATEMLVLPSKS